MSHYNTTYSKCHVTDLVYKLYIFDIYNLDKESKKEGTMSAKNHVFTDGEAKNMVSYNEDSSPKGG